jgi:ubiquinone/menaquinone biosynthesis C-methylase UbiE
MGSDVEKWLKEDGEIFLRSIGVKAGQVILDYGCGAGHYTITSAKIVGKKGKVYAIDRDNGTLNRLMQTAESEGLKNIVPIKTSEESKIDLEDESIDVVLLYDILHYIDIDERRKLYSMVYRILKTSALLSVYPKHHKLDEPLWKFSDMRLEDVIKEIEMANFYLDGKDYKRLIHDDNYDSGYILSFTKK